MARKSRRLDSDMTQGSIWRQLIEFSLPMMIGLIFQQLYNTVDTIVVGQFVGKEALAAVGTTSSIINMLVGFAAGLSTGSSVIISQCYGSRDHEGLHKAVHTSISITFILAVAFTALGVLGADTSLYVDHYRAAERTFNLLTQVIGRAGRGSKAGRAVIQTYTPQNDVIQAAAQQDYQRFYDAEIQLRRLRRDPPFSDQFTVTVTGQEEDAVRQAIALLTRSLRQAAQQPPYSAMELQVLGPAPASVVKVNGSYRYRTMVLGRNDRQLRQLLAAFMREFAQRGENRRLHIYTDCNLMD